MVARDTNARRQDKPHSGGAIFLDCIRVNLVIVILGWECHDGLAKIG
jgi:hypothetical protein